MAVGRQRIILARACGRCCCLCQGDWKADHWEEGRRQEQVHSSVVSPRDCFPPIRLMFSSPPNNVIKLESHQPTHEARTCNPMTSPQSLPLSTIGQAYSTLGQGHLDPNQEQRCNGVQAKQCVWQKKVSRLQPLTCQSITPHLHGRKSPRDG